jgi:hypothetical protein
MAAFLPQEHLAMRAGVVSIAREKLKGEVEVGRAYHEPSAAQTHPAPSARPQQFFGTTDDDIF